MFHERFSGRTGLHRREKHLHRSSSELVHASFFAHLIEQRIHDLLPVTEVSVPEPCEGSREIG